MLTVEVSAKQFGTFVYGVLDLDCNTSTNLASLHHIHSLVVDLERCPLRSVRKLSLPSI
jgi:hypothetical protein